MGGIRRGPHNFTKIDKPQNFKNSINQLVKYLGRQKWIIALVILMSIVATALNVLMPRLLGAVIDEVFAGFTREIDFSVIRTIIVQLIVTQAIVIAFSYLQGYTMAGVSMRIMYQLRKELSDKIHRLPLVYFDKNPPGDVLSRIANDTDTLSNTLNQGLTQMVSSAAAVIGIIVMMLTISPILTLVSLLTLPLTFGVMAFMVKKSQKHFSAQQKKLGTLNGHIEEMFSNHEVVKAFNGEKSSVAAFDEHNAGLYESNWRANFLSGLMMPMTFFISNIGYVVVVIIGGSMALAGNITIGGIQAFIQYNRQFGQPISTLASVAATLQQTAAAAERVFSFLGEEEEVPDSKATLENVKGLVEFNNISFGYNPNEPVIHNFKATVEPGQKIAIVGHTGAGKTTIVKLLMRFYDVDSGIISIDGTDIREFSRSSLRSLFGMVLQDTWLFNGTIADNIRYGNLTASQENVKKAAKAAQADHFIRAFPEGYEMLINEEADNISAGQKQLLTIARTILADPQMLILDEATSNVDTRTEVMIQKAMDNLMEGRTSFVIAHRLSTIRSANLILVMENGDIVEQGSHDELLAKGGVYMKLYNSQFDVA